MLAFTVFHTAGTVFVPLGARDMSVAMLKIVEPQAARRMFKCKIRNCPVDFSKYVSDQTSSQSS